MSLSIYELLLLFLVYAFLGWCTEVCFVAVSSGKVVNRGFLNGPVCPIYGVGMIGVLLLLEPVSDNLFWLFFFGALLCSAVELVGGWVLEKVFHTRWWDYTNQPFHVGGYICLKFSIMWGLAVAFVVRQVHPLLFSLVSKLPHMVGWILIGVCYALFVADFVMTLVTIIGLRRRLGELERVAQALHSVGDSLSDRLGNSALAADAKLDEVKQISQEKMAENKEKLEEAKERSQQRMAENKEKLEEARERREQRWAEQKEALEQKVSQSRQELEQRQKELLRSLTEAPKLGTRRLGGAFPNLKKNIRERVEKYRDKE